MGLKLCVAILVKIIWFAKSALSLPYKESFWVDQILFNYMYYLFWLPHFKLKDNDLTSGLGCSIS